jgi:poly(A) polymerase
MIVCWLVIWHKFIVFNAQRVYMSGSILTKIKKIFNRPSSGKLIIPRSKHNITRSNISGNALKVLYRLKQQGFEAYLVGGGVRDLLLGLHPKDFDVATNATPEQVRKIFNNCRLIGRRFRLAHVVFGRDYIEVATFRKQATADDSTNAHSSEGMIMRDNAFGSMEEDAWRRDFTVNALYYNIKDFSVVDFTGGIADLKQNKLRMIGNVVQRYREDPVRILRAIRFSAKLGLKLDKSLVQPIDKLKHLIKNIPQARLYEEVLKLFHSGAGVKSLHLLQKYKLLDLLLGSIATELEENPSSVTFVEGVLRSTDERVSSHKPIQPAFVLAALVWHSVVNGTKKLQNNGMPLFPARMRALEDQLSVLLSNFSIPKRTVHTVREICQFQLRLERRDGKRAFALINEPRFRAAYDFLLLRSEADKSLLELANWWTTFQDADNHTKKSMTQQVSKSPHRKRRKKKPQNKVSADK